MSAAAEAPGAGGAQDVAAAPTRPGEPGAPDPSVPDRVGRRWVIAFVLAIVGIAAGWFGPIQILLPAQSARIAGTGGKESLLALVTAAGAVASMIANPLWGALSDRLRSRWGRRRPVALAGTVVGVVGLLVLAAADGRAGMTTGWVLVQIGLNGPLAALAAMMADRVPEAQRGVVGAWFGIAQTLGLVVGTAVAVVVGEGALGYVAIAVAVPALGVAILLVHDEGPTTGGTRPGAGASQAAARPSWRALRPTTDYLAVWTLRLLLNLVNALLLLYLYYYLSDGVGVAEGDVGTWVLVLTGGAALVTVGVAAGGGVLSDRTGRRRAFVAASAVLLGVSAVVMATLPPLPVVLAATVLFGIGWGLYVSVDLAVLTAVLPDASTRATMLGIGNVASSLPQVLAPVVAAPLVTSGGGYPLLYGATAALAVLALLGVRRLRVP
jgi:MFS family permease